MIHTSFYQGAKVRLIMKTGEVIVSKYLGHRKGKSIQLESGTYRVLDIRSANYYKPLQHEQ